MSKQPRLKILRTGADASAEVITSELTPLVHVHIPKCAGTTLDHVLLGVARACGRPGFRFQGTIYGQGFSGLGKAESWKQAEGFDYPKGWLFASGHIPYGRFSPHPAHEVSIIRDPLPRLMSMFKMGVRRGAWSATTPIGELFDLGHFAGDSMVRQLGGETSKDRRLDQRSVDTALGNFENIKYAGRIEDFDSILGSILADYNIPYVAFQKYQVGDPIGDQERNTFAAAFAPFMELDQAFFDLAAAMCPVRHETQEVTIRDIAPSAPVLLVSPYLMSEERKQTHSAFVTVATLAQMFDL